METPKELIIELIKKEIAKLKKKEPTKINREELRKHEGLLANIIEQNIFSSFVKMPKIDYAAELKEIFGNKKKLEISLAKVIDIVAEKHSITDPILLSKLRQLLHANLLNYTTRKILKKHRSPGLRCDVFSLNLGFDKLPVGRKKTSC